MGCYTCHAGCVGGERRQVLVCHDIYVMFLVGFHPGLWDFFRGRKVRLEEAARSVRKPVQVPGKVWRPKQPQIPRLESYDGVFPPAHWALWPEYKPETWRPDSWLKGDQLEAEGLACGYPLLGNLRWAADQLTGGADTGVKGAARLPSAGPNAKSAIESGHLLSDSLAEWVRLQLMAGPFDLDEIPWPEVKISPLGLQIKPSGAGRILVDMSFPWRKRGEKVNIQGTIPISPNAGIELEDFPAVMDGTPRVLFLLSRWGPGCHMTKAGIMLLDPFVHV